MKAFLFAFCTLSAALFAADTSYFTKYNLPDFSKSWALGNKIENEKGATLVYIPKDKTLQTSTEFFGVNINKQASDIKDTSSFKKGLMQTFPKMNIDIWELEKNQTSILYEWSGKEGGKEKVHGWGRAFVTGKGSVVLGYLTENIADIARARSDWIPVLKGASPR